MVELLEQSIFRGQLFLLKVGIKIMDYYSRADAAQASNKFPEALKKGKRSGVY